MLEQDKCDDPHVERLLEGVAFLAARVHLKIDDEFPEITEALLSILYPHYIRPIPSMSIIEFHMDPESGKIANSVSVPRGSTVFSKPVGGVPMSAQEPSSVDHGLYQFKLGLGTSPFPCVGGSLIIRPTRARGVSLMRRILRR